MAILSIINITPFMEFECKSEEVYYLSALTSEVLVYPWGGQIVNGLLQCDSKTHSFRLFFFFGPLVIINY